MNSLRTASTRRLLAAIAGLLVAVAAGTAIAVAATGAGPVPRSKPLARAVHDALAAAPVSGISARVTLTNHLIDSGDIQGVDPLLTGGSGRLWWSAAHGLRVEVQSENGDAQLVINASGAWAYDPASNTVYKASLPARDGDSARERSSRQAIPTVAEIQSALSRLMGRVSVSGASPSDVAGRPAYTVRVAPQAAGGLIGGASLSWDAVHGTPLRFALYARGSGDPVLELSATDISYGAVPASVFAITPPRDAHVVSLALPALAGHRGSERGTGTSTRSGDRRAPVTGLGAVARRVPFALDAPASLAGLSRSSVTLVGRGADAGALIGYGQGLGGVYVLERRGSGHSASGPGAGADGRGLALPSVTLKGASAQELPTALGTVLSFSRAGVRYTVAGSVSRTVAERAARGL